MDVSDKIPPQELEEVAKRPEGILKELCVLGVEERDNDTEELFKVWIEVSLEIPGQLHKQAV